MLPSGVDVLTATALLAHASLVPAGAGVVAALLLPRRGVAGPAGPSGQRVHQLRHLASTGQLAGRSAASARPQQAGRRADQSKGADRFEAGAETALAWLRAAAACTAASGTVHAAAGPHHAAEHPHFGAFFVAVAVLQFGWTARALLSPSTRLLQQALALNVAVLVLWATTRTIGLPFGLLDHPERVGAWDLAAGAWELGAVLCCAVLLTRPTGPDLPALPRLAVPVLVAGSVALLLALAATGAPA